MLAGHALFKDQCDMNQYSRNLKWRNPFKGYPMYYY